MCALSCEIYVMRLGYLISEFYYGLYDVATVLTLYRCGYVPQGGPWTTLYDLMLMGKKKKILCILFQSFAEFSVA